MKDRIRAQALSLGFTACGFVRAADVPDNTGRLHAWLEAGCHGDMAWMEVNADRRAHPQGLWPAVRSVVALGMSYAAEDAVDAALRHAERDAVDGAVGAEGLDEVVCLDGVGHGVRAPRHPSEGWNLSGVGCRIRRPPRSQPSLG